MKNVAFLFFIIVVTWGCTGNDNIVRKLDKMYSKKVVLEYDKMAKRYCSMFADSLQYGRSYNLVYYIDSININCAVCDFLKLARAEYSYLNKPDYKNMSLTYVIREKSVNIPSLCMKLRKDHIRCAVYIDTLGIFRKHNPQIPDEEMFHTFLLDERDSVVLVGDPVRNDHIADLLKKVVNGEIKK